MFGRPVDTVIYAIRIKRDQREQEKMGLGLLFAHAYTLRNCAHRYFRDSHESGVGAAVRSKARAPSSEDKNFLARSL